MEGSSKISNTKPRKDLGSKRGSYHRRVDNTGKTFKENAAIKSFWSNHKMQDIIQLSIDDLNKAIDKWISDFQEIQIKRDPFWWFPNIHYDPTPKKKGPKKVNSSFNSSFIRR